MFELKVEDNILSLSALLLDETYYGALNLGRTIINGVSVLNERLLIPFKARAYLDLSGRKQEGEKVDSDDIKKHRKDVFRLLQLIPEDAAIELPKPMLDDLRNFVGATEADKDFETKDFGMKMKKNDALAFLKKVFRL